MALVTTAAATWLHLLLSEAPAADLRALREEQLATGDAAEVEELARTSLQLHALLREREERAGELAVLSDMAAHLSASRDVDDLLGDIPVQARRLLRADVAYLALDRGDSLEMRFTAGMLGPERTVLLSTTEGLAGQVFTTGQPAWTSDYLADASFPHHPALDGIAGVERLTSILAVPLRARGQTLGVLFAGHRTRRTFADREVQLLAGLGSHAAVALDNALLASAEREAQADLTQVATQTDRAVALHERLTGVVIRGGGPSEVVAALADVLAVPVQLLDASVEPPDGAVRVVAGELALGSLVVDEALDAAALRLVERGAMVIALALVQERAVTDAMARSRGDVLAALVEGGEAAVLERRAAAIRIDLRRPHRVVVVAPLVGSEPACRSACAETARRSGGIAVERADRTVLLLPEGTSLAAVTRHGTAGTSDPVVGAAGVPDAFLAARRCLQAMLALGRLGEIGNVETLGLFRFLLAPAGQSEAREFVRVAIGPLLEHDEAKSDDLARTLEEYLASGRQHGATAEALHIHSNTLYQRMARITVVLGEGWRSTDAALHLHMALRLQRLSKGLDGF